MIITSGHINTPKDKWVDFFRECRLEPQIKMAEHAFSPSVLKQVISLLDRLDDYLSEPAAPSLLHGDMWGGNHLVKKDGKVILIDPAAYVGHAEADLAMTQMFQPMHRDFYEGYFEINPRMDGYEDRREIYNLYHMLNHYNLFGGSYLTSAYHTIAYYA